MVWIAAGVAIGSAAVGDDGGAAWSPMRPALLLERPLAEVIAQKGPPASGEPGKGQVRYGESWFGLPTPLDVDYLSLGNEPNTMHQITLNFPATMKRDEIIKAVDVALGQGEHGPSLADAPSKYFGHWIRSGVRFDLQDYGDYIEMYIAQARLDEPANFGMPEATALIQSALANVVDDEDPERVLLAGVPETTLDSIMRRLQIIVQDGNDKADIVTPLAEGSSEGYEPEILLRDFTGDGLADVFVRAATGGSGGIYNAAVYSYAGGVAAKVFDTSVNAPPVFRGTLIDGYRAALHVEAPATDVELDLSDRRALYDELGVYKDGVVAKATELWGEAYGLIEPVDNTGDGTFELRVVQQVRATSNADRVAEITSILDFVDGQWAVTASEVKPIPAG